MKTIKKYLPIIILFVLFLILGVFLPLTSTDLNWANTSEITNFWLTTKGSIISSVILLAITKVKIIRVIFWAITAVCFFIFMKNIINKNNKVLIFIGLFLFLLLDNKILNEGFFWTSGYVTYFIGGLMLLIVLSYIANDNLDSLGKIPLFILGLISMGIAPIYSILIFSIIFINLIYNKVTDNDLNKPLILFLGSTLGLIILMYGYSKGTVITYIPNLGLNLIENVIPMVYENNFLIAFILLALLIFLSVKVFLRGNKITRLLDILSIASLVLYAVTFIFDLNLYFKYVAFILNMVGSYYILSKVNNSIVFKRKIRLIYLTKIIYLIILDFSTQISSGNYLIVYILDILVILEIVNYLLPNEFMNFLWLPSTYILLLANIYVYANTYYNFNEMNLYIRHHLECNDNIVLIPSKYKTDHLYDYVPTDYKSFKTYLEYYDIKGNSDMYVGFED